MKKSFLFAIFAICQIKASADFLTQIYTQIDKDKYQDVKELLTKNIKILNAKELNSLSQILRVKKETFEKKLKNNPTVEFYIKKACKVFGWAQVTSVALALCTMSFGIASSSNEEIISYLNEKIKCANFNYKDIYYASSTSTAIFALAISLSIKKLINSIWSNKITDIKNMIKEIEKLALCIDNQLVILNTEG